MKQLNEVSASHSTCPRLIVLQDCDTLKKGFVKLRDKYAQLTAKASALENELSISQGESEQLRLQVTNLKDELKAQNEALEDQVTSTAAAAAIASRQVRVNIQYS